VEKLADRMIRSESRLTARELAEQGAANLGRRILLREPEEAAQLLARRSLPASEEAVLSRFNRLHGVDDGLRAEFRALTPADKRLAIELGEGVQAVLRRYPEEGPALLQALDASGLAQARTYGDFVVDGTHWLQTDEVTRAVASAKLPADEAALASQVLGLKTPPETLKPEHVGLLWKSVIRKTGEGAGVFWKTYVQPHKGKWLAGGLLTTYLVCPERFHDAAGRLTEYAVGKLAELGVAGAAGAGRGLAVGPAESLKRHYAEEPVATAFAVILIVACAILAIPAVRRVLWQRVLRPMWVSPKHATTPPATPFGHHEPLRE
jgi:hypothetical protein